MALRQGMMDGGIHNGGQYLDRGGQSAGAVVADALAFRRAVWPPNPRPKDPSVEMDSADTTTHVRQDVNDEGGIAMRWASLCALAMAGSILWLAQMPPGVRHQSILMLVPAFTAAVGPFLLFRGVRAGLRTKIYGRSVMYIEPPVRGEPLRGVIRTDHPVDAIGRYTIRLRCEDVQGHAVATTLFKSFCHVPFSRVDSTRGIPFRIDPLNAEVTDADLSRLAAAKARWWIDVHAMTNFITYDATFEISDLLLHLPASSDLPWWMEADPDADDTVIEIGHR